MKAGAALLSLILGWLACVAHSMFLNAIGQGGGSFGARPAPRSFANQRYASAMPNGLIGAHTMRKLSYNRLRNF